MSESEPPLEFWVTRRHVILRLIGVNLVRFALLLFATGIYVLVTASNHPMGFIAFGFILFVAGVLLSVQEVLVYDPVNRCLYLRMLWWFFRRTRATIPFTLQVRTSYQLNWGNPWAPDNDSYYQVSIGNEDQTWHFGEQSKSAGLAKLKCQKINRWLRQLARMEGLQS